MIRRPQGLLHSHRIMECSNWEKPRRQVIQPPYVKRKKRREEKRGRKQGKGKKKGKGKGRARDRERKENLEFK